MVLGGELTLRFSLFCTKVSFGPSWIMPAVYLYFTMALRDKIEGIQYSAIRSALGYLTSTPKNILNAKARLSPTSIRAEYLCKCYLAKIYSDTSILVRKSLDLLLYYVRRGDLESFGILTKCAFEFPNFARNLSNGPGLFIFIYNYGALTTSSPVDINWEMTLKQLLDPNFAVNDLLRSTDALEIFTDGKKGGFTWSWLR